MSKWIIIPNNILIRTRTILQLFFSYIHLLILFGLKWCHSKQRFFTVPLKNLLKNHITLIIRSTLFIFQMFQTTSTFKKSHSKPFPTQPNLKTPTSLARRLLITPIAIFKKRRPLINFHYTRRVHKPRFCSTAAERRITRRRTLQ